MTSSDSSPTTVSTDEFIRHSKTHIAVHSVFIVRDGEMIGESQVGTVIENEEHRNFVLQFIQKIITSDLNASPYTIYLKKHQFLLHVLYSGNIIVLSLTANTVHQSPVDSIFDLLRSIHSALPSLNTLDNLHHEYQLRARPKISLNFDDNPLFLEEDFEYGQMDKMHDFGDFGRFSSDSDDDVNLEFCENVFENAAAVDALGLSMRYSRDSEIGINGLDLPSPSVTGTAMYSSDYHTIFHGDPSSTSLPLRSRMSNSANSRSRIHSLNMSTTDSVGLFDVMDLMEQKEILAEDDELDFDESIESVHSSGTNTTANLQLPFFILKRGWLHKIGSRFKTRNYRYFELWSNGLLNYFDDEIKRKQRGSIDIADEVINCSLELQCGEYGFLVTSHERTWHFVANSKTSRDDWVFLVRTIALSKINIHRKVEIVDETLKITENLWNSQFKNAQFDVRTAHRDRLNIYRVRAEIRHTLSQCTAVREEMVDFRGSDIYLEYEHRMDRATDNLEGALSTIESVIRSRNEGPLRILTLSPKHQRITSCGSMSENMAPNGVTLSGKVDVRLPSKSVMAKKRTLSKRVRSLQVEIRQHMVSIPPLVWRFDEIESLKEIKGVYYGTKKDPQAVDLTDIQRYEITVEHSSGHRVQLLFYEQERAFEWFTTLKRLYEQTEQCSTQSKSASPLHYSVLHPQAHHVHKMPQEPVQSDIAICNRYLSQIGL